MNLNEYQSNGFVPRRICVYGPPKVGKTELVGALAAFGYHLFFFDLEDGIKTLLRPESKAKGHLGNIEHIRIPDNQSYPIAIETVRKVVKGGDHRICYDHGTIACWKCLADEKKGDKRGWADFNVTKMGPKGIWIIDSISQLVSSTMNHITREQIKKDDDYKPDWDDWRKQGFILDGVFSAVQTGSFNIIGICHEEEQKLENGQKRLVPVGGTGNYSKTFAKYWDDVVYVDVINGAFKVYSAVEPGIGALVGSRAGKKVGPRGLVELFE